MHIPPPQSNSVLRSHVRFGAAEVEEKKIEFQEMDDAAMHEIAFDAYGN
jgi:hypothetical protein